MKVQHWSEACIGDEIDYQKGDTFPFTVSRDAFSYRPLPHQLATWGRNRLPLKFRMNKKGNLERYQ